MYLYVLKAAGRNTIIGCQNRVAYLACLISTCPSYCTRRTRTNLHERSNGVVVVVVNNNAL